LSRFARQAAAGQAAAGQAAAGLCGFEESFIVAAGEARVTPVIPDTLTQIFGFLYSAARYLGIGIIQVVRYILPSVQNLDALAEPVGFMALLTLFVILTTTVRKIALIILIAGWALIFIRLLLLVFRIG
jgi:hypothetical protein